ncbi:MAG: hypothetical protein LH472_15590 [Pyrinomonadaceae bacterium]|nr:hypothetical protein [Pyrinomonadaceae bacterium]
MKDSLTKAEQELKEIEGQLSKSGIADSPKNNLSWITWLLLGFAGLAGLVSIGLTYRILNGRINQERETNKHGYRMAEKRSQELNHRIEQLEKTAKLQSGQLTQFQTAIQSLQRQATERGGQNFQPQTFNEPPIFKPEPQFPVAAEDYLNKNRSNALTAAVDHYTNKLVQDANKGDEFLIVKDNGLANDLLYAVPNVARFSTKGDYLTYYQNYYACENPSGGAVWIKSPTTVRRVDGGWQLEEMGELEIK